MYINSARFSSLSPECIFSKCKCLVLLISIQFGLIPFPQVNKTYSPKDLQQFFKDITDSNLSYKT